jgi:hypothetical protein
MVLPIVSDKIAIRLGYIYAEKNKASQIPKRNSLNKLSMISKI